MKRIRTPETIEKIKATNDAQKAKWAAQTLRIDEDWKIRRADELNWEIQFRDEFYGYYGTLPHALKALPYKMLDEQIVTSLHEIQYALRDIETKIDSAVARAKFSE